MLNGYALQIEYNDSETGCDPLKSGPEAYTHSI